MIDKLIDFMLESLDEPWKFFVWWIGLVLFSCITAVFILLLSCGIIGLIISITGGIQ